MHRQAPRARSAGLVAALLLGLLAPLAPRATGSSGTLLGTVLDAGSGAPIRGAYVLVVGADERYVPLAQALTTDGCGRFEVCVAGLKPGGALLVVSEGYEPSRRALADLCPGRRACLALTRGREVRGRAVDAEGRGVPGVRLWAHLPGVTFAWPHTDLCVEVRDRSCGARAVSDAEGRFVLRGLADGTGYLLRGAARGWLQVSADGAPGPAELAPTTREARLTLRRSWEANLVALDAEAHEPVGALAALRPSDRPADVLVPPPHAWLAPGLLRVFEEDPVALRLVALERAAGAPPTDGPALRLAAAGHEDRDVDLEHRAARSAQQVALLERRPGVAFTRLRAEARTRAGPPFTGLLDLRMETPTGLLLHRVPFRDGVAAAAVLVPRSGLSVAASGAGPHAAAWTQCASAVPVDSAGEGPPAVVRLLLTGNPVTLEVSDASGRAVRGFGLSLVTEAAAERGSGPAVPTATASWSAPDWDTPGVALEPEALQRPPLLWVNPGRTRLNVQHPDLGSAQGLLEADGDGRPLTLRLTLAPGGPRPPASR